LCGYGTFVIHAILLVRRPDALLIRITSKIRL
jgi:hypothetical protein